MLAKRAKRRQTATAVIRTWRSSCGQFAVEEINSFFGLPRYYVVTERLRNGNGLVVSRHRKRTAAAKALAALTGE